MLGGALAGIVEGAGPAGTSLAVPARRCACTAGCNRSSDPPGADQRHAWDGQGPAPISPDVRGPLLLPPQHEPPTPAGAVGR